MATQRPIGGVNYGRGTTPQDAQNIKNQLDRLMSLAPRSNVEKVMNEVWEEVGNNIRPDNARKLSKEERRLAIQDLTNDFVARLVRGWCNALWNSDLPATSRLDGSLLPQGTEIEQTTLTLIPLLTKKRQGERVNIFNIFVSNLKKEVDKQNESKSLFVLFDYGLEKLEMGSDERGYFLRTTRKS